MEKVYEYYKIEASEDYYRVHIGTASWNSCYQLGASSYELGTTVLVPKEKQCRTGTVIEEIAVPYQVGRLACVSWKNSC